MSNQFKTNQIPDRLAKLQKPGYFILDNDTRKVYIMPNGAPATFKTLKEAEEYITSNNINGIVK
jgi:hypothetical protein